MRDVKSSKPRSKHAFGGNNDTSFKPPTDEDEDRRLKMKCKEKLDEALVDQVDGVATLPRRRRDLVIGDTFACQACDVDVARS